MKWDDRIGARLKLRDLHILMTVVHQGGMGRAAKHLAVSQPVISKAISDLESVLKVRLLDRTSKGTEPTTYGGAGVRWGSIVFDELRNGIKEIELLADPTGGEVRIASAETLNANFVPTVIGRLNNKFPRLVYSVLQESSIADLCNLLRERRVDLVVSLPMHETAKVTIRNRSIRPPCCITAGGKLPSQMNPNPNPLPLCVRVIRFRGNPGKRRYTCGFRTCTRISQKGAADAPTRYCDQFDPPITGNGDDGRCALLYFDNEVETERLPIAPETSAG
jgi:DNA-binding transcriptional LysR family regulator